MDKLSTIKNILMQEFGFFIMGGVKYKALSDKNAEKISKKILEAIGEGESIPLIVHQENSEVAMTLVENYQIPVEYPWVGYDKLEALYKYAGQNTFYLVKISGVKE